jgi:CBS domain-containing protein
VTLTNEHVIEEEEAIADERAADAARIGAAILGQPIRELATLKPVVCVPAVATVRVAVERMNHANSGCVLVEDGGRLVGIFTERDVLTKVVGTGLNVDQTRVGILMTRHPETLSPDDQVAYALNMMSVGGFRHIPLVDEAGRPVGLVSMRNVVDYMVELFPSEVLNLPPSPQRVPLAREGA